MQGVYSIKNKLNGKFYVGSSADIERRWEEHKRDLRRGQHHCIYLQRAWEKYGEDSFEFLVLEELQDIQERLNYEQKILDNGFSNGVIYNISIDAFSGMGNRRHSIETLDKLRGRVAWNKGVPRSAECKRKLSQAGKKYFETHDVWNKGIPRSEECKAKISLANKGKSHPFKEETKQILSKQRRGEKNPFYGKTHTEEARQRMGDASRGRYKSEETKDRMSKYNGRAKPYPAFYNELTNEYIHSGKNILRLCRKNGLHYYAMLDLVHKKRIYARDGWRLATEEEISQNQAVT